MKEMFKNKKIGFYLMIASALLALMIGVVFFLTYKDSMANNAAANVPEVIGICALLCFVLETVAILVPEHKWVHLGALVAICFSLMKEIYLIPNLLADYFNGVAYQGGNLPMNLFYIGTLFVIVGLEVAVAFLDVTTEEKPAMNKATIVRYSVNGGVALVATLASIIVISSLRNAVVIPDGPNPDEVVNKINVEEMFKDKVVEYDFDPKGMKLTKEDNEYSTKTASELSSAVGTSTNREGHNLVYQFEGFYAEGYQGDYSKSYAYIYLWDDGLYNGSQKGNNIYGYWYNQDDKGEDCLIMSDNSGNNDIVCVKSSSKFYDWIADLRLDMGWGTRTIKVNGYYYYPVIGMYIDTGSEELKYDSVQDIKTSNWTAMQVRNDFRVGSVFDPDKNVTWTLPKDGATGEQEVKATWNGFEATVTVTIGVEE